MTDLLLQDQTYKIIGACMEVHRELGGGFAGAVYKDALAIEFNQKKVYFEKEVRFDVYYKDLLLPHSYFADLVVYDEIIVEVKAVKQISDAHVAQILNYMKASNRKVGLLVNFSNRSLEHKRFVL